jgi:hypothetical protein
MAANKKDRDDLIGCRVGLDLLDGTRLIGKVAKWDDCTVYIDVGAGEPLDIPKNIIQRVLVLIKGNEEVDL